LLGSRIVFLAVRSEVSVAKAWAVKYDGGGPHLHESFKCPVTLTFSPIANRIPISIFIPQTAGYGTRGSTYISVRAVVAGKRNSLPRTRSAFSTRSWPQAPTAHSKDVCLGLRHCGRRPLWHRAASSARRLVPLHLPSPSSERPRSFTLCVVQAGPAPFHIVCRKQSRRAILWKTFKRDRTKG
jgi:hypothetical protein